MQDTVKVQVKFKDGSDLYFWTDREAYDNGLAAIAKFARVYHLAPKDDQGRPFLINFSNVNYMRLDPLQVR